jgi:hypothetical protein
VLRAIAGPRLKATTGDDDHDRIARTAVLNVLKSAVSAETFRDSCPPRTQPCATPTR